MPRDEAAQRAVVVAEARSWIRTPVLHGACLKGAGVDCGQFLLKVFSDCGLIPPIDLGSYPPDWFMHREDDRYLDIVRAQATETAGPPEPGDVILFHVGRNYGHGAIVTKDAPLIIVHAFPPTRVVMEEPLRREHKLLRPTPGRKPPLYFTCWPKG
jgi:cell wall-associated NlpC family hydrolase